MRKLLKLCTAAAIACALATPALASRYPAADQVRSSFVDVAAEPAYPEAAPAVRRHVEHRRAEPKRAAAKRRCRPERRASERARPRRRQAEEPARMAPAPKRLASDAAQAAKLGAILGIPEGFADGIATAIPVMAHAPARLLGFLEIGALRVRFGSGGAGYSLDYGDYRITPDDVGAWGSRHGALGIAHDSGCTIYDARLRRDRCGIELHADTNGELRTAGCVAVKEFGKVKAAVLAMISEFGQAFLRIDFTGARIEPDAEPVIMMAAAPRVPPLRTAISHRRWQRRHVASAR